MEPKITRNDISTGAMRDFARLSGRQALLLALLLAALLVALALTNAAHAAPHTEYVVTSALNSNVCDANACTLRGAINAANANPGQDTIKFNLPDAACNTGACLITLNSQLPVLTDSVIIDGYTQSGASPNTLAVGNDAVLRVMLKANTNMNGFVVQGDQSEIRGLAMTGFGIAIQLDSHSNIVEGNFIGTNVTGTGAGSKNTAAVWVNGGEHNRIGGTTAAARNLFSGNDIGIVIDGKYAVVQGNYVGTNASGTAAILNQEGIRALGGHSATIGGAGKLARNVIAANDNLGIYLTNSAKAFTIQNNFIGIGADGKAALGNYVGIVIDGLSINNVIRANRIANNVTQAVRINDSGAPANNAVITRNAIYNNGGLGIDIKNDGVTPNDAGDGDTGPNYLQNFPVVKKAFTRNGKTIVRGVLLSQPNETYRIELFLNVDCNAAEPNDYGEGKKFLGAVNVTTDAMGKAKFKLIKNKAYPVGRLVTATATYQYQNYPDATSEFSKCVAITAQ